MTPTAALALAILGCGKSVESTPVSPVTGQTLTASGVTSDQATAICVHATTDGGDECSPHAGDQTGIGVFVFPERAMVGVAFVLQCTDCDPRGEFHMLDPSDAELLSLPILYDPSVPHEPGLSTHFLCFDPDCPEQFEGSSMTILIDYEDGGHECQFFDGTWSSCAR